MSKENVKIAIPSFAPGGLDAMVNTRFGRCEFMTIITLEDRQIKEVDIVPNQGNTSMGGAGSVAAQLLAKEGVSVVIGANYGPNAAYALNQGGIKTYGYPNDRSSMTVKEIVNVYLNNQISEISGSNVPSHTGMQGGQGFQRSGGFGRGGGGGGGGRGRGGRPF